MWRFELPALKRHIYTGLQKETGAALVRHVCENRHPEALKGVI